MSKTTKKNLKNTLGYGKSAFWQPRKGKIKGHTPEMHWGCTLVSQDVNL